MSPIKQENLGQAKVNMQQLPGTLGQTAIETISNVVGKYPGTTLLISAGIGVLVGCLIKRR